MVHGACSSSGCYSMTDAQIEQIYAFGRDAFRGGQTEFQIQAFPFRMTAANMARYRNDPNFEFWKMLKEGYDQFEITKVPPKVDVCEKRYVFNRVPEGGATFNATAACPPTTQPETLASAYQSYQSSYEAAFASAQSAKTAPPPKPTHRRPQGSQHRLRVDQEARRGERVPIEPPALKPDGTVTVISAHGPHRFAGRPRQAALDAAAGREEEGRGAEEGAGPGRASSRSRPPNWPRPSPPRSRWCRPARLPQPAEAAAPRLPSGEALGLLGTRAQADRQHVRQLIAACRHGRRLRSQGAELPAAGAARRSKRLAGMPPGSRLWLETTDPLAVIDIPAFCAERRPSAGLQSERACRAGRLTRDFRGIELQRGRRPRPALIQPVEGRHRSRRSPADCPRARRGPACRSTACPVKAGKQPPHIVLRHVERDQHEPRAARRVRPGRQPRRRMQDASARRG